MELVYALTGEFIMGSEAYADEKPQRTENLDAYRIDRTEVTNAMYAQCVANGACSLPVAYHSYTHDSYFDNLTYAGYPVMYVDGSQASAYCQWAGRRLPTEAEWEKAGRGEDGRTYSWGEQIPTCSLANYSGCVGDTQAVGSYPEGASPYGALDMAGNMWEWVADVYPGTKDYMLKGGDWQTVAWGVRSAVRGGDWEAQGRSLWGSSYDVDWYDCYGTRTDWYCDFRGNTESMSGGFRCALSP